jgi:hypothetical protein|tara:strand:+ start:3623 stop:3820 length:198 start_codon:yes stop_codon:yes gene_type:complete
LINTELVSQVKLALEHSPTYGYRRLECEPQAYTAHLSTEGLAGTQAASRLSVLSQEPTVSFLKDG